MLCACFPVLFLLIGGKAIAFVLSLFFIIPILFSSAFVVRASIYLVLVTAGALFWSGGVLFGSIAGGFTIAIIIQGLILLAVVHGILELARTKEKKALSIAIFLLILSLVSVLYSLSRANARDSSFSKAATSVNDGFACQKIGDIKTKDGCLNEVALATNDIKFCAMIVSDMILRSRCIADVEKSKADTYPTDFDTLNETNFKCNNGIQLSLSFNSKHNLLRLMPSGSTFGFNQSDIDLVYAAEYRQSATASGTYEQQNATISLSGDSLIITMITHPVTCSRIFQR
jgi:hypothetical protein